MILIRREYGNFIMQLSLFVLLLNPATGYPTRKMEPELQPEEKMFPNGTVIGKYAYYDKEGNPVEVKYYADDASYGVELSSVKVSKKNEKAFSTQQPGHPTQETPETLKNIPTGEVGQFDVIDSFKYPVPAPKYKSHDTEINKEDSKTSYYRNKYKNPEYEVYMQNDLNAPNKQCKSGNEKVLIYNFEKESGKVHDAPIKRDLEPKYCERY